MNIKMPYLFSIILISILFSCTTERNKNNNETINTTNDSTYQSIYQPDYITENSKELVAIVLTIESCGYCSLPETKRTIGKTIDKLSVKADSLDIGLLTIGVSLDWVIEDGFNHLKDISSFDEVIIGNNWYNSGGLKYIFDEMPGTPMVPQIVLTERIYDANTDSSGKINGRISGVKDERVIVRQLGVKQIEDWLNDGVPIPDL
jgi:hypothetical protein